MTEQHPHSDEETPDMPTATDTPTRVGADDQDREFREALAHSQALIDAQKRDDAEHDKRRARAIATIKQRVAALAEQMPSAHDAPEEPLGDTPAEMQAEARRRGWAKSLVQAHVTGELGQWTLESLLATSPGDQQLAQAAHTVRRFVDAQVAASTPIRTLIIAGNVGTGKSSLAVAAGHYAIERGLLPRFVSHDSYVTWLRPGQAPEDRSEQQVRSLFRQHTDLLVLDDLGAGMENGASEAVMRETVALLGDRFNAGQPSIITTNLTSEQVKKALGERAFSRIAGQSYVVKFVGEDRRKPPSW